MTQTITELHSIISHSHAFANHNNDDNLEPIFWLLFRPYVTQSVDSFGPKERRFGRYIVVTCNTINNNTVF